MPRKWQEGDPHYGEYQTVLFGKPDDISEAEIIASTDDYLSFGTDAVVFGGDFYTDA